MIRKMACICAFGGLTFAAAVLVGGLAGGHSVRGMASIMKSAVEARVSRKTVADRIREVETKRPDLIAVAREMLGDLTILMFKRERRVELWASGWREPRMYAMTEFSGQLGPKLKEGDGQIPEGVYAVEYLNPNSRFHLSLKVSYPNGFDRVRAKVDGRTELGGDIMIHGGAATVGCACHMVGFAVASFRENGWGGLVSQGIGTSMLQIPNIMKKPVIMLPEIISSAILGPLSTCVFGLKCGYSGGGMGTSGLVGIIDLFDNTPLSFLTVTGIILLMIVLPAVLNLLISEFLRKKNVILFGDQKLPD